jgi:hypothetical protein
MRRGGVLGLRKRNLTANDQFKIYRISVYEGEQEEYFTFCTPECRQAVEEYFAFRERCGEKITADSLVIRDSFFADDVPRAGRPRSISVRSYNDAIERLFERAGVRKKVILTEGQKAASVRHEVKATHGFRKFFDTQMTLAGVSEIWTQLLEGHELGLKGAYLRPTENDLLQGSEKMRGYIHAIDDLTIDPANRLQKQVGELKQELAGSASKSMVLDLMNQVKELRSKYDRSMSWRGLLGDDSDEYKDYLASLIREGKIPRLEEAKQKPAQKAKV